MLRKAGLPFWTKLTCALGSETLRETKLCLLFCCTLTGVCLVLCDTSVHFVQMKYHKEGGYEGTLAHLLLHRP